MIAIILFAISIIGLVYLLSILKGYTFEDAISISVTSKVLILFFLGIAGWLKAGVYIIVFVALIEFIYGTVSLIRRKSIRKDLENFFSIGLFVWVLAIILICWCMRGKMFDSWDEFSHWGDIVKVMATLDDFGTNPLSFSWFKSYLPGMSLFQYYLQKTNQIIYHVAFSEWLVYVAYQVFVISFIIPIICKCRDLFRSPIYFINISLLVVFVGPQMFGSGIYRYLYIDPVLGVLFACGLTEILWSNKKSKIHMFYIASVCSMLSLAKDAGLLFAIALFIAYALNLFFGTGEKKKNISIAIVLIFTFLPTIIWKYHLKLRSINVAFSGKYDFKDFINVITNKTESYRTTVYACFKQLFFTENQNILGFFVPTYAFVLAILLALFFVLVFMIRKKYVKTNSAIVVFCGKR